MFLFKEQRFPVQFVHSPHDDSSQETTAVMVIELFHHTVTPGLSHRNEPWFDPIGQTKANQTTHATRVFAVNVHMIRTIWATEYIKDTKNVVDAAFMLGDTVETVLKSYAKLLDQDCGKRASQWVAKTLENEPPSVNGNSGISRDKLEKILRMLKASLPEGNSDEQLLHSMKDLLK